MDEENDALVVVSLEEEVKQAIFATKSTLFLGLICSLGYSITLASQLFVEMLYRKL